MEIRELVAKTGLNPLTPLEDRNVTGVFISDMMSDVMTHARAGDLWITVQTHKNIVSSVNLVDIAAVVITHGKTVLEDTIELGIGQARHERAVGDEQVGLPRRQLPRHVLDRRGGIDAQGGQPPARQRHARPG